MRGGGGGVLEITRGQMAQNKKALKRMKAFQGGFSPVTIRARGDSQCVRVWRQ